MLHLYSNKDCMTGLVYLVFLCYQYGGEGGKEGRGGRRREKKEGKGKERKEGKRIKENRSREGKSGSRKAKPGPQPLSHAAMESSQDCTYEMRYHWSSGTSPQPGEKVPVILACA